MDRNGGLMSVVRFASTSLSARRAWIEIFITATWTPIGCVALRKESVDRNSFYAQYRYLTKRRSPQGERG